MSRPIGDPYGRSYKSVEKKRAREARFVANNPGRRQEICRISRRFRASGWTQQMVDDALAAQSGLCALCPTKLIVGGKGTDGLCADHDHDTNRPRGLLCKRCNTIEGFLRCVEREGPEWLQKLMAYRAKHRS
jgi:hypothetical protein